MRDTLSAMKERGMTTYGNLEKSAYRRHLVGALSGGTLGAMYGHDGTERGEDEDPRSLQKRRRRNTLIGAAVGAALGGALGHMSHRAAKSMTPLAAVPVEEQRRAVQEYLRSTARAPTTAQGELLDDVLREMAEGGHPNERLRGLAEGWANRLAVNSKGGERGFYMGPADREFVDAERIDRAAKALAEEIKPLMMGQPTASNIRELRVKLGLPAVAPSSKLRSPAAPPAAATGGERRVGDDERRRLQLLLIKADKGRFKPEELPELQELLRRADSKLARTRMAELTGRDQFVVVPADYQRVLTPRRAGKIPAWEPPRAPRTRTPGTPAA